jgi:outer membrane biosynthesis protein TonB
VTKYKDNIQGMLESCKEKIDKFDAQIDQLNSCEEVIKAAEQKIRDTAIKFIADVRSREKQLIEEVQNIYGKECMDYIKGKKDLSTTVDGLRSTCNLTEVILKGKDIELLLLKKDVQAKLASLGEVDIKTLPQTIDKQVSFVPGELDMGYVHDMDRPLLSKMRTRKIGQNGDSADDTNWPTFASVHTQTEKSMANKDDDLSDEESDSEESSEEESESESETEEKPETEERGVQTDPPPPEKPKNEKPPPQMKDESIITDTVATEEKAVNTRSRSLQSLGQTRKSPPKETTNAQEDALAARRRRRRERAAPGNLGSNYSQSLDIPDNKNDDSFKRRSRFLNYSSMDNDDMFYDAPTHTAPTI